MWVCVFVAGIVYDFGVVMEEQVGKFDVETLGKMRLYSGKKKLGPLLGGMPLSRGTLEKSESLLLESYKVLCWAAKSVLVMVKDEAAEGIRKATLLVLVGVDEGSLMEVSMIPESTNDATLPAEQD